VALTLRKFADCREYNTSCRISNEISCLPNTNHATRKHDKTAESNFVGETCGLVAGMDKTSGLRERICEYSAQNIRTAPKTPPISMYTGMYGSLGQSLMNCTPAKINSNIDFRHVRCSVKPDLKNRKNKLELHNYVTLFIRIRSRSDFKKNLPCTLKINMYCLYFFQI